MTSNITVAGQTLSVVSLPASPNFRQVEFGFSDSVAIVRSPFTGQTQAQQWLGADEWSGTMTLPWLNLADANAWTSFLMECRGMAKPFLLGDPMRTQPSGDLQGAVPVIDGVQTGALQTINIKGLPPSLFRLLLPGDNLQLGYRLHRVLSVVNSDSTGRAAVSIYPATRDSLTDGQTVILNNPQGLFRRANNKQTWSASYNRLTALSFQVQEYR